jgi:outer membrane protein assembly factor BamB
MHAALAAPAEAGVDLLRHSGFKGGVVVHLGCGDGKSTAALDGGDAFLVHGLDTEAEQIESAREHLESRGSYGRVSAEVFDGRNLPYGDNVVNLIVVDDRAKVEAAEIVRVLAPGGKVLLAAGSEWLAGSGLQREQTAAGWSMFTKAWPDEVDQWTHYLYDSSGNAVTGDLRVRRPRHMQWWVGPKRSRHHDALASMSAMTSSNGRVFYIFDEGSTSLMHRPAHWKLIARDGFNGKLLWKRDIPDWMTHLYNFRAGPKQLPRRLVSIGDELFVTLGLCAPVTKLDAATGKTLHTYADSHNTEEIICHDGMLLAVIGDPGILIDRADGCHGYWELAEHEEPTVDKSVVAYDAGTGERLWEISGENLKHLAPLSLCALGDRVLYLDNRRLHCHDAKSGDHLWAAPFETEGLFLRSYAPTVVAHGDVALCLKWNRLCAFSIATGEKLWENKGAIGFGSPGDLFVIGDTVWTVPMTKAIWRKSRTNADGVVTTGITIPKSEFLNDAKTAVGIDVRTGEIVETLPFAHTQHHHRCYRNKATPHYLLIGHSGIQVVDLATRQYETHRWVRGLCQYGIMPANGLLYVPPDTCQCYGSGKINGFFALSEENSWAGVEVEPIVDRGPAFAGPTEGGEDSAAESEAPTPSGEAAADPFDTAGQWPTFRGNICRSGSASCRVPEKPAVTWKASIGPTATAPTVSGGRVFIADRDGYAVHCLDARSGRLLWKYLAGGPVDSPPTIHKGLCIFGCGDGSVYCLDADTGELAWRFRTSQIERRIGQHDRLQSPLAIHGSTLVVDGTVYFAAGYSSNLDGGIRLYGLDVHTGRLQHCNKLASGPWGDDGRWGFLADILVSDGRSINMRGVGLTKELTSAGRRGPIVATTGFLEGSWFHRMGWHARGVKGQLIAFDEGRAFGVVSPYTGLKSRRKGKYAEFNQVGHFHQKFTRYKEEFFPVGTTVVARSKARGKAGWSNHLRLQPRAMVLAGDTLCLAGWLDDVAIEPKTGRAKDPDNPDPHDSVLRYYSADGGEPILERPLPAEPVFDAMAVAEERLFVALASGDLVCFARP